ncbi:hypothetical protein BpHYR1_044469 [Brachionus plicatilis]|uniref:Uncharacterized protein n=1 Tax=Brachionus plicatilis TaxID=10195 RepID=A0A3M7QUA7_BRAPC|nr:hypothetical protein BpHYR1_044469 [Brachionus plicatilis]
MEEEVIDINLEENKDRFFVLLFNCIYYKCNTERSWSIIARKIVINQETQKHEFCYLVQIKSCCHDWSLLTLWVDQSWMEDSDRQLTEKLILKFEQNLRKNKLRGYLRPNIEESINYCDKIIDEFYNDSHQLRR